MILMSKYKGQHGGKKGKKSPPPLVGQSPKEINFFFWEVFPNTELLSSDCTESCHRLEKCIAAPFQVGRIFQLMFRSSDGIVFLFYRIGLLFIKQSQMVQICLLQQYYIVQFAWLRLYGHITLVTACRGTQVANLVSLQCKIYRKNQICQEFVRLKRTADNSYQFLGIFQIFSEICLRYLCWAKYFTTGPTERFQQIYASAFQN